MRICLLALCQLKIAQDPGQLDDFRLFAASPRLGWQSAKRPLPHGEFLRAQHEVLRNFNVAFFEHVFVRACVQSDFARALGQGVCRASTFLANMREVAVALQEEVEKLERSGASSPPDHQYPPSWMVSFQPLPRESSEVFGNGGDSLAEIAATNRAICSRCSLYLQPWSSEHRSELALALRRFVTRKI